MPHFERTNNSTIGWVSAGEFWSLPNVALSYGPLKFCTHDLDACGWVASFAQKRPIRKPMRAYIRLFHPDQRNSGFTIKLPAKVYGGWHDVLRALASVSGGIQFHAKQEIASAPHVIVHEVEREPIVAALARHNAETLQILGDWRPSIAPPDLTNVVQFERIIAEIESEAA